MLEFKAQIKGSVEAIVGKFKKRHQNMTSEFGKIVAQTSGEAKKHAPVDTGRLRASINFEAKGFSGRVYTNVSYAKFVEFGHKRIIVPVRAKALRFYIRGVGWLFRKRVEQGLRGKSARWEVVGDIIRKPFFKPAADWAKTQMGRLIEAFKRGA